MHDDFLQQFIDNFLQQQYNIFLFTTHRAGNKLDLSFCNSAEVISDVLTSPSNEHIFPTDHYIIEFSIRTKFARAKPVRRVVYDYSQADFSALRRALSESPLDISLPDNIDYCWEQWKVHFLSTVSTFVPATIVKNTTLLLGSMVKFVILYAKNVPSYETTEKTKLSNVSSNVVRYVSKLNM